MTPPKKRLDDTTLEAVAELICGAGQGGGGAAVYEAPGPYRSKSEIYAFFARAGVKPAGQSSTRKWFALESLQVVNSEPFGNLLPSSLEKVLLRLATPKEYRGDASVSRAVVAHLNRVLQVEGLEIILLGVDPQLRERAPGMAPPERPQPQHGPPPNFSRLVGDPTLANILIFRWEEAQRCLSAGAYLSAVIMMGSILEGVLLHKVEANLTTAHQARCAPKERATGRPKPINEWGLSTLIDVAHDVGWLQGDVKRFSHSLRESRNIVHPYVQRLLDETPDSDTCSICWQVVRAAVADLLQVDQQNPGVTP